MDIKHCRLGTIDKNDRIKIAALNNLNSFKEGGGKVATIDVMGLSGAGTVDLTVSLARTERRRGEESLCASCRRGYSKFNDKPDECVKECQEGCDICSASSRGECLKCDSWRGYYEVDVSSKGFVKCQFSGEVLRVFLALLVVLASLGVNIG